MQGPSSDEFFLVTKSTYDYDVIQITNQDKEFVEQWNNNENDEQREFLINCLKQRMPSLDGRDLKRATFSKRSLARASASPI